MVAFFIVILQFIAIGLELYSLKLLKDLGASIARMGAAPYLPSIADEVLKGAKAQFFEPVSAKEKFDKAQQITDLTDE